MGYKIIDWTRNKTFEFGFFEDAETFFKDYRYDNPLSMIDWIKIGDNSSDSVVAKYVPN